MRASEKRKNNILIGVLLGIVVLMGIAYATFASNLNITGTSSMTENWCIGFDSTRTSDYTAQAGIQGGTTPTGSMSFSGDSCGGNLKTTASLNASFKQPGDKVEYTLTIGNKGTLAAAIESIEVDGDSVTSDTTITKGNIKYIIEMPLSTSLAVNATTTMKVTAMFQNDIDISSSANEQQTISIAINAVQDDGSGGMDITPAKFTGTIYAYNLGYTDADTGDFIGDQYQIGEAIPEGNTYKTKRSEMTNNFFLKHDVVDDIITASYVCFVYNNAEHCMKGADSGASFATNTQIIQDYQTFYNLNTVSNPSTSNPGCAFNSSYSYCYGGGFYEVNAGSYGDVYAGSSSGGCNVYSGGDSSCNQ